MLLDDMPMCCGSSIYRRMTAKPRTAARPPKATALRPAALGVLVVVVEGTALGPVTVVLRPEVPVGADDAAEEEAPEVRAADEAPDVVEAAVFEAAEEAAEEAADVAAEEAALVAPPARELTSRVTPAPEQSFCAPSTVPWKSAALQAPLTQGMRDSMKELALQMQPKSLASEHPVDPKLERAQVRAHWGIPAIWRGRRVALAAEKEAATARTVAVFIVID